MFDKKLFDLAPETLRYVIADVVLQMVSLLANIAMMVALGFAVQDVFAGTQAVLPQATLGIVAVCIAVRAVASYAAGICSNRAAVVAKKAVRSKIYAKLVALGPAYSESVGTSEAVQLATEGADQLEVYFGGFLPQLFSALLAPIVLFACLVFLAPAPAIVLLVCVPLIPGLIMAVRRKATAVSRAYWGSYTDLGGMFLEDIQGLTTLKIFQADGMRHRKMNEMAEKFRRATMRMLRVQLKSIGAMDAVAYGGAAVGITVALVQFSLGILPFAAVFAIVFLSQEFFLPMRALGSLFHAASNGMAAASRMFELLETKEPERGTQTVDTATCSIECRGVGYTYPAAPKKHGKPQAAGKRPNAAAAPAPALVDASVTFPQGSFTGIVGKSGAGKSTLASVISGRMANYTGEVLLNGVELSKLTPECQRALLTVVPSNGFLFKGTVRENLAMGNPEATDEAMEQVLARCGMAEFVRSAGGLDMEISEGSTNLSGGQRQRICMARALLRDTPAYLFDEATSSIDAESERVITAVIQEMARERTVIVIAHRLSLIADADSIVVVNAGRIAEVGTRAELLEQGGTFADLWNSQRHLEELAAAAEQDDEGVEAVRAVAAAAGVPSTADVAGASGAGEAAAAPSPAKATPAKRSNLSIMMRLIKLVGPLAPYMVLAIAMGVVGFLAAIFLTVFASFGMVDVALGTGGSVVGLCVAAIVCGLVRGPLRYSEQLCNHYIAFSILARIRDVLYAALRRLAPAKLEGHDKGDLVSTATADIELLEVFYAHTISPIAIATIVSVCMLVFFGVMAPTVVPWALLAYVIVGAVMPVISSKSTGSAGMELRRGAGAVNTFTLESLRGLPELLQFGRAAQRAGELDRQTEDLGQVELKLKARSTAMESIAHAVIAVMAVAMVQFALTQVAAGTLGLGAAFVVAFAFMSSFGPVVATMRLGTTLQQTFASGARVLDILDEAPQTPDVTDGEDVEFAGAALDDVSFSYAGEREQVLSHVSFEIPRGSAVALVGENGTGKSTTMKLLMRFWDATAGSVQISDEDVRRVNTACLRANEGYMTQDTHLFVGTIGENIRLAKQDATDEELRAACAKASVLEMIEQLPHGFDTPAGELGGRLSGGERQRIGLARIFLQDAPFILLDEPTSNIDALNEAQVLDALERERAGKTIVLVSHRASTRALADRVVSLDK